MGILSLVGKGVSKLAGKVVKKAVPVANVLDFVPAQKEVDAVKLVAKQEKLTAVREGFKQGVTNLVSKAVSNPIKTLGALTIGLPLAVGFLSTKGGRETVANIPSTAKATGETLGDIAGGEKPLSDLDVKDVLKTGTIVGTGVAIAGAGVLAVDKFLDERKQDSVLGTDDNIPQETGGATPSVKPSPIPANSPIATTPQGIATQNISKGTTKKRRSTRLKTAPSPIVRVNNKVIVNNKNYLKNK